MFIERLIHIEILVKRMSQDVAESVNLHVCYDIREFETGTRVDLAGSWLHDELNTVPWRNQQLSYDNYIYVKVNDTVSFRKPSN